MFKKCSALFFKEGRYFVKNIITKLLRTADFYIIIFLYFLSFFVYNTARNFPVIPGVPRAQNPGFYPLLLAGLLGILTTLLLISTLKKVLGDLKSYEEDLKSDNQNSNVEKKSSFWGESTPITKGYLALAVFMTYIYIHFLNILGFILSTFIFMTIMSRAISSKEKFKTSKLIIISIVVTGLFYLIFDMIIGIRFPSGILFQQ